MLSHNTKPFCIWKRRNEDKVKYYYNKCIKDNLNIYYEDWLIYCYEHSL